MTRRALDAPGKCFGLSPSRHLRWLGPTLFVASVFGACNDGAEAPKSTLTVSTSDAAFERLATDAQNERDSNLGIGGTSQDAAQRDATPPDAGEQPFIACHGDAGASDAENTDAQSSGECGFPRSRCVDDRLLLYYRDGKCVDGRCRWREEFYQCRYLCTDNGCNDCFTAPP